MYVGVDLHANNNFVEMVDQLGKGFDQIKLPNDLCVIEDRLKGF